MAGAKLIVIYPRPTDIDEFDKVYGEEHVPMAVEKLSGKTRIVATRILGSPQGVPPFHVIAEVHFPTIEALQNCAASDGGKETLAHAASIWRRALLPFLKPIRNRRLPINRVICVRE